MANFNDCTTNIYPELCGVNVIVDPASVTELQDDRVLIVGHPISTSPLAAGIHDLTEIVRAQIGDESPLMQMITEFEAIAPTAKIWIGRVENIVGGSVGEVVIEFDVQAGSGLGTVYLWVNGQVHEIPYDPAAGSSTLRNDALASIQANSPNLVAIVDGGVPYGINIKSVGAGTVDGFIDVRSSYSRQPTRVTSSGAGVTINVVTVGSGTSTLAAFPSIVEGFSFVVSPYADTASASTLETYACSQWQGGDNTRIYGVHYGTPAEGITFAQSMNSPFLAYQSIDGALTPPFVETASFAALAFNKLNCKAPNIAGSFSGTVMPNMLAPEPSANPTKATKADMVDGGIGYYNTNRVNEVIIGRAVTTRSTTSNGSQDLSMLDINKPSLVACVSRRMRVGITERFAGHSFRSDGVVGTALSGQPKVATIVGIRNYIISLAEELSSENVIQDMATFVANLTINVTEGGCISIQSDPTLVDQFCCLNLTLRTI